MFMSLKRPLLGGLFLLAALPVSAGDAPSEKAYGVVYQPVPAASAEQVRVVYYRTADESLGDTAAHLYVDREFHTGLLSGGYATFCMAPGTHSLGAYLNDAPTYKGKSANVFQANFQPGKTYFLRVNNSNTPEPVARAEAEAELQGSREQVHMLSRASTVTRCEVATPAL